MANKLGPYRQIGRSKQLASFRALEVDAEVVEALALARGTPATVVLRDYLHAAVVARAVVARAWWSLQRARYEAYVASDGALVLGLGEAYDESIAELCDLYADLTLGLTPETLLGHAPDSLEVRLLDVQHPHRRAERRARAETLMRAELGLPPAPDAQVMAYALVDAVLAVQFDPFAAPRAPLPPATTDFDLEVPEDFLDDLPEIP